jgi:hypothetical protein
VSRLSAIAVLACLLCFATGARGITIEAEGFVASHNEGGNSIVEATCSAASGGKAVEGFDYPGDWIEVVLVVGESGSFTDTLRSAGLIDSLSSERSTIYGCGPSGEDLVSSFAAVGMGIY